MSEQQYGALADAAARKYGVPTNLFRGLIKQESGWNPGARNAKSGATGMTQVMPDMHPNADLSTPQGQLDYGAKYLGEQLRAFGGDPRKALAAYNAGPGRVQQFGGVPPPSFARGETHNYVNKIMGGLGSGQQQGGYAAPQQQYGTTRSVAPVQTPADPKLTGQIRKMWAQQQAEVKKGKRPNMKRFAKLMGLARQAQPTTTYQTQERSYATAQVGGQLAGTQATGAQGSAADGALMAAHEHLGVPYSWGGGTTAGPGEGFGRGAGIVGFDCSSLVQYAWAKQGVKLPRTTYEQIKSGVGVDAGDRSQWRPGDLLFPHDGHVEMYIGNGKIIHAPQTGGHVEVKDARSSNYTAVRRVG